MKKHIVLIVLVFAACACLAGCAPDETSGGEVQVKYAVYCSLNDADTGTQMLSVEEAQKLARGVITDRGLGYTEYVAYGGFVDGDKINGNDTLVYTFFFIEKTDAQAVAVEIKESLNLASVLMEQIDSVYDFVS